VGFNGVATGAVGADIGAAGIGFERDGFGRDGVGLDIGPRYLGTVFL
jgi:hypothetical protein